MGFSLGVSNAPSGSKYWWADYSAGSVYSGWLDIAEVWDCPYGAYGKKDLHIWVVDGNYNTKHDKTGLGPIYDDKSYTYDCSTGKLSEGVVAEWKLLDTVTVTLAPLGGEVAEWKLLDTVTVTLAPLGGEVAEWKLLDTKLVTLAPPEISCSVDADCPEGYVCKDGKCVKKEAKFPWQWLAIAGAAIAGVILLIPRPKKAKEVK